MVERASVGDLVYRHPDLLSFDRVKANHLRNSLRSFLANQTRVGKIDFSAATFGIPEGSPEIVS